MIKEAHESDMGGYISIRKTSKKVLEEYYWPDINSEVVRYSRQCDWCNINLNRVSGQYIVLNSIPVMTIIVEVDREEDNSDLDMEALEIALQDDNPDVLV